MLAKMATIFQPRFALRAARAILADVPVAASWFVTNRCNFSCDFCQYPSFNTDKKQELTPAEFGRIGEKLARVGVVVVAIIGGEPFIRKDLPEIVAALSRHVVVQITTNGWLVTEEQAARVFAAGVHMVSVSLDSPRAAVHDGGRRQPGAYDRALRAARMLRDAPKRATDQLVGFESIVSGRNATDVDEMVELAEGLGVKIVFQPYSAGHVAAAQQELAGVTDDVSARFRRLKADSPALLNNHHMIDRLTPYFRAGGRIPGCGAGRTCFNIDAYARITRCEEQRRVYGDLRSLDDAGIRAALEAIRSDTRADGCDTCYLRTRGETEPLYGGDFGHFLVAAQELFGVALPAGLVRLAGAPAARPVVRAALELAARAGLA
jgi:MoaA/NifB/PqqE/SkfB family radical SAM enzyme